MGIDAALLMRGSLQLLQATSKTLSAACMGLRRGVRDAVCGVIDPRAFTTTRWGLRMEGLSNQVCVPSPPSMMTTTANLDSGAYAYLMLCAGLGPGGLCSPGLSHSSTIQQAVAGHGWAIQAINSFPGYTLQLLQRSFAGNQSESGSHGLSTTINIDRRIANESKMSIEQRRSAHEFSQTAKPTSSSVRCKPKTDWRGWKPSEAQEKLLKGLLRHYHIKPNGTYTSVVSTVQNYILEHAEDLHLAVYKTDPIVKKIIDKLLADEHLDGRKISLPTIMPSMTVETAVEMQRPAVKS
ncbi:hypothetical protein B0H10DRAFT_2219537 [Mycena sp. CBHHK59/15]|nr:hypothetical protein B0H10DRAFT_2219537 [Mycena sp. CBHHK59/15]